MPKKQSTAARKARQAQKASGGKHTALLAAQTCGRSLDPWVAHDSSGRYEGTCARAPHPDSEPCAPQRDFDATTWKLRAQAEQAEAEARWQNLSPQERADAEHAQFEAEHDDGYSASDAWEDARAYKWED